jgi:hypothetical protein
MHIVRLKRPPRLAAFYQDLPTWQDIVRLSWSHSSISIGTSTSASTSTALVLVLVVVLALVIVLFPFAELLLASAYEQLSNVKRRAAHVQLQQRQLADAVAVAVDAHGDMLVYRYRKTPCWPLGKEAHILV